ncbi:DNA/RNA non-specific endonuclease [Cytobacillus firmus]|uniref:DNA/RNA non-specific endonuclease n=2 Tax=Cytobacillus TaxID=2675230 RepID=A0A366JHM9_CYTFI|nr:MULTISPECIES: DNA/RNA non-specific endonuclease [Cytobacillus]RBP85959.1 DNA/RNA non-specific endonuclease [Cytobacillus firmus]TDX36386.1 DNA/RNA non-specific endonuclease [Cytobacillus oceanisediminis]
MKNYLTLLFAIIFLVGCTNTEDVSVTEEKTDSQVTTVHTTENSNKAETEKEETTTIVDEPVEKEAPAQQNNERFPGYKLIEIDGGDLSGYRQPNIVVDIGFEDRKYWAFTNEHGQLVRVIADEIILQDDSTEPVLSSGRYYSDEAKVPGVERDDMDEGHIIADSMGGVSNAYNITPQESTLNRHGDQAYMEDAIRKAGGATDFEALITYPNTETQIPSHYQYTYTLKGNKIVDKFDNVNPDKVNESHGLTGSKPSNSISSNKKGDISSVDTNGNGQVTIQEAKDAGYSMPIMSDHWLYPYMRDNDNDGMVGE